MNDDFSAQTCVVTGGASGIGAAISRALAAKGARVVILDLNLELAQTLAQELDGAIALACDVSDDAQVDPVFAQILERTSRVDVLVNNAGHIADAEYREMLKRREASLGAAHPEPLDSTISMSTARWKRMMAVHLDGTFFCSRAALRPMCAQRRGAIVNMSSVIGLDGGEGIAHYAAAKAGILGLTRSVAREVAPLGVRVNAVAPGFIDTGMRDLLPPKIAQRQVQGTPMGRLGRPDEIADTVLYLAGGHASFITGQVLSVNGGYLSR